MKKAICLILILTLLLVSANTAFAANDVVITATVSEAYEITIPAATTNLTWGQTTAQTFGNVGLSSARLEPGHQVTIAISGNEGLANNKDSSKKIIYSVMDGSNVFTSANFTNTTPKTLTIVVEQEQWDAAPAGSYSDTVTFTATVTDITP